MANSQEINYGFGQMGSAFSNIAQPVVPPKGMVIIAIQALANNKLQALVPEKMSHIGPNMLAIDAAPTSAVDAAGKNYFHFNGAHASEIPNTNVSAGNDITLDTPASPANKIKVGQYVLLVNGDATANGGTAMVIDTAETPIPNYTVENPAGVKVTAYDGVSKVKLSADITPTSDQALIFVDETHGAGAQTMTSDTQIIPTGLTIYGRWTTVTPEADPDGGIIVYFGY